MFVFQIVKNSGGERGLGGEQGTAAYPQERLVNAIGCAAEKTQNYMYQRTKQAFDEGKNVLFGPSIGTYFYRLGGGTGHDIYGAYSVESLAKRAQWAAKRGIPLLENDLPFLRSSGFGGYFTDNHGELSRTMVSRQELSVVFGFNLAARLSAAKESGGLVFAKHFPFDDGEIELTEQTMVRRNETLAQVKKQFQPALDAMNAGEKFGVMVSHAIFPKLEQQMKDKYGEMRTLNGWEGELPSSLSPYIIRGLLRKEIGFEGIIMSDAMGMQSIKDYVGKMTAVTPEDNRQRNSALAFICGVYAGIDWMLAMHEDAIPDARKEYATNKEFKKALDSLALESLFLRLKAIPVERREEFSIKLDDISLGDLSKKPFELSESKRARIELLRAQLGSLDANESFYRKFAALTIGYGEAYKEKLGGKCPALHAVGEYFILSADTWNRGGLITMEFRKNIVEELSGKKFLGLGDFEDDGQHMGKPGKPADVKFMEYLSSDAAFQEEYRKINWSGPEMARAFEKYMKQQKPEEKQKSFLEKE